MTSELPGYVSVLIPNISSPCMAYTRVYPKVSGLSHKEIYAFNNKYSLRSNTKGYGGKTHYTDSQNSDTTAPSCRELYHL